MLPPGFKFSQSSLQDYVDCPRRFQLRYVEAQVWPGVRAEPLLDHERDLERGSQFHRLIERHQLGMAPEVLAASIDDPDLLVWWRAYLGFEYLHTLGGSRYPEYTLGIGFEGFSLAATCDLLVVVPGERVVIFDWKTFSRMPSRRWFKTRLQTRVYLLVVTRAVGHLFGGELSPGQVSMVYWLASCPADPVVVEYGSDQQGLDEAYLAALVAEIRLCFVSEVWSLAVDEARCMFCEFRSLCERGSVAGQVDSGSNTLDNIVGKNLFFGGDGVEGLGF